MIHLNDIVYLEAEVNYTLLHAVSGRQLLVARTLKLVEEMLPAEGFFRIHKSYVVNMNYLKSYSKTEGFEITLETGEKLPVAQRKNEEFLRELTKKKVTG